MIELEKRVAVPFEPVLCLAEAGAGGFDQPPESNGMVGLAQVHQFVDQDVLAHGVWHQQEPVVQRDVSARRAGSPARALVADRHFADLQAEPIGQRMELGRQLARGARAQCLFDRRRATC